MKLVKSVVFLLVMCCSVMAYAVNKDVKVDVLMSKITTLLKADKAADALKYMAELEGMEPTLSKPLPESFHFFYIDTLDKAGDKDKALKRAELYVDKFGKKGKHYGKVVEIMSRLQIDADKAAADEEKRRANEEKRRAEIALEFYPDVVTDTRTGLMWVRNGNIANQKMKWNDAMAWVKTIDIGGYRDWRLPTEDEFLLFADRVKGVPSEWFNVNGFYNVQSDVYWTSTIDNEYSFCSRHMYLDRSNFRRGEGGGSHRSYNDGRARLFVWPVRGGQ